MVVQFTTTCTPITTDVVSSNPAHGEMYSIQRGRCGRDRIVVRFTTIYAISAYHHYSFEFESCSWRGVLDTILCDKVNDRSVFFS